MSCADDDVNCREALEQVYEYLYGELDAGRLAATRAHVEHCQHCQQEYGVEREIHTLIARSCCLSAPDELRARIVETITEIRVASVTIRATQPPWTQPPWK